MKSAVVSVRTPGVWVTTMRRRLAAVTSMLSHPTATFATIRSRVASLRSGSSIVANFVLLALLLLVSDRARRGAR